MEKDIVDGKIGEVGAYDVEFKGGKLVAKADAAAVPGGLVSVKAAVSVEIDAKAVFAAIKAKIPGNVDDAILGVVEAALLG